MSRMVNDIDVEALRAFAEEVKASPSAGEIWFGVSTIWQGGTKTRATTQPIVLGGKSVPRPFTIDADEPEELLGTNTGANPQELLLAALNACVSVGYVATAAAMGIKLRGLRIHTAGKLDLRGFLGLDAKVNPGYDGLTMHVDIDADAAPALVEELHAKVRATSPNFANVTRAIPIAATTRSAPLAPRLDL